jgi:hypothetical protein
LLLQLVSFVLIDSVVSMTIATLYGPAVAPLMDAVAVAVRVTDFAPTSAPKNIGTVTCCLTCMAFAVPLYAPEESGTHAIPSFDSVVRHSNLGYPNTIETFFRLEKAFLFPDMLLYVVALLAAAVKLGKPSAAANTDASVEVWSRR